VFAEMHLAEMEALQPLASAAERASASKAHFQWHLVWVLEVRYWWALKAGNWARVG
jgi:hypothetical protein